MTKNINNRDGLKFFGRVSASVSHDIKNVLAIINEEAGLIQDLCRMAEKGMEISPERFMSVAGNILGQIRRGDEIVKCMNTFAHSVDHDVRMVDVAEVIKLLVKLSARLAGMKNAKLELGQCSNAEINIDVYGLEQLLFNLILTCLDNMGDSRELFLGCEKSGSDCLVTVTGAGESSKAITPEIEELAQAIDVRLSSDDNERTIKITMAGDPAV